MPTTSQADPAVSAVRAALDAAGHELSEITVARPDHGAGHLIVRYNPLSSDTWDLEEEYNAGLAKTLRRAGWERAADLGALVFLPDVPPATSAPTAFVATWRIAIDNVPDAQQAADEARGRQLDPDITESLWTVTDAVGRTRTVHCFDPDPS
jgi:CTP:molybdopterin cytidylyltransferase MocA